MIYWALFVVAAILMLVGVPLAAWWERRADEREMREWLKMPGATR